MNVRPTQVREPVAFDAAAELDELREGWAYVRRLLAEQQQLDHLLTDDERHQAGLLRRALQVWARQERLLHELDGMDLDEAQESPEWTTYRALKKRGHRLVYDAYCATAPKTMPQFYEGLPPPYKELMQPWFQEQARRRGVPYP